MQRTLRTLRLVPNQYLFSRKGVRIASSSRLQRQSVSIALDSDSVINDLTQRKLVVCSSDSQDYEEQG
jgi:hypothetical protein